ncbi:unnamed protein product, partial [Ectocarpus sp. 12 AP-2014]
KKWLETKARDELLPVRKYAWDRIRDHPGAIERETLRLFEGARLLNFTFVKQHELGFADIDTLGEVFPFVTTTVLHQLVTDKDEYNIAASNTDAGIDLWAFW